jgi:glycosyltransferase involved in cell wall biosynthesis
LNICFICPEISSRNDSGFIGGGVNSALRLSQGLSKKGHEITIVTTPHRYTGDNTGKVFNWADVVCLPVFGNYLSLRYGLSFTVQAIVNVRKLHHQKKFDVIHVHSGFSIMGLVTAALGRITGVPTVHTLYCPAGKNTLLKRLYLTRIDKIVAISLNISDSLRRIGVPGEKIAVIPPGIDQAVFNPQVQSNERKNLGIYPNQPVLLYVGNLGRRKGISVLLEALAIIAKNIREVKLLMVLNIPDQQYRPVNIRGAESDMELLDMVKEQIKTCELEDKVVTLGIMPNLAGVMTACDILVAPFRDMTGIADYPISVLEGMACGKPVIATRVGGMAEIIHNHQNGLLVSPDNYQELADAIQYLLGHRQEAAVMGSENAKLVSREFAIESVVDRMEHVYQTLVSRN